MSFLSTFVLTLPLNSGNSTVDFHQNPLFPLWLDHKRLPSLCWVRAASGPFVGEQCICTESGFTMGFKWVQMWVFGCKSEDGGFKNVRPNWVLICSFFLHGSSWTRRFEKWIRPNWVPFSPFLGLEDGEYKKHVADPIGPHLSRF